MFFRRLRHLMCGLLNETQEILDKSYFYTFGSIKNVSLEDFERCTQPMFPSLQATAELREAHRQIRKRSLCTFKAIAPPLSPTLVRFRGKIVSTEVQNLLDVIDFKEEDVKSEYADENQNV